MFQDFKSVKLLVQLHLVFRAVDEKGVGFWWIIYRAQLR